ncbi:hypothetical protein [Ochrobactrum chromiisoli]|uniref:Uncharacterized protein n=1 Tax=Ochrobactrum chromiisoli TaxID=2993941 RepID=A0ABT3QSM8_9HYPH|nr:hypothetical protein [Ochrobactrum chromiisoli]MCX2698619.1 hypothetical protein [Ochrobactrum chromiisoli]
MKITLYGIALMATLGVGVSFANEPPSREEAFRLSNQVRKCFRMPLNQSGDAVIEFRLHKNGKCQPYQTLIVGKVRVPFIFKSAAPIIDKPKAQ